MTAIESKRPSLSRKSIAGQILFVVVLLIVARILWTRTQPERLTKPRISVNFKIVGDNLYGVGSSTLGIQVQSIRGSKTRTLVPEDPDFPFYYQSSGSELSIVDGSLYYIVKTRSKTPSQPNAFPNYTAFLLPPDGLPTPPIARQKRDRHTRYPSSADEITIRQIPLQGGAPHDVATFHGDHICLIGSHVFWIRPEAEETGRVIHQGGVWWEATAHSDLMFTSLSDGTTRCICHGIYRNTLLKVQATGISWTDLRPYPDQPTLFYANASDGVVHALSPLAHHIPNPGMMDLVELEGRLYWRSNNTTLMSSTLDGADIREVSTPPEKYVVPSLTPFSYRNSLYFYMQDRGRNPTGQPPAYLCRLHPGSPDAVEILRKLPSLTSYTPCGDYLYFGNEERHRPLWASLTNDGAAETSEYLLCRIPLKP